MAYGATDETVWMFSCEYFQHTEVRAESVLFMFSVHHVYWALRATAVRSGKQFCVDGV